MENYKQPVYPVEPWTVMETAFDMKTNFRNETTFALSNGYIGTRGTFEEAYDFSEEEGLEGNFVNGFYESEHIRYGEWNFGFPTESQSLLNLPNGKIIHLFLDDGQFDMRRGSVSQYNRTLHMKEGTVTRELVWTSPLGKQVKIETKRFVSFSDKNLMCLRFAATPLNFDGKIRLVSELCGDVENHTRTANPLVDYGPFGRRLEPDAVYAADLTLYYQGHTLNSGLSVACGCGHIFTGGNALITYHLPHSECGAPAQRACITGCPAAYEQTGLTASVSFEIQAVRNQTLCLDKNIVYTVSMDMAPENSKGFVTEKLAQAKADGYQENERRQAAYMKVFWESADVRIQGDGGLLQQGIRFNLFHIMQAAGRDGKTGMPAKGLSGEGYEGHYFWDTEMYILPVFTYTASETAKKLLDYRIHTLTEAKDRAIEMGHPSGALYPWRTINGKEASTYFPLGTAQYHINADIAYGFRQYLTVTGDMDYLNKGAAEVICETARVWADVGCFSEYRDGRYCICAVTGPDEYNAIVDNNSYTNLMAREHLKYALEILDYLKSHDATFYQSLVSKINLKNEETEYWKKIIENMYFPYEEKRQVYPQDDGFLMRKPWDESKIAPEKRHLLYENYHPLFIYRQRMCKQADAILGMYLHSNLFTREELKRNYDFYQEVTLHHSSLSTCIFGILACEIGYYEEAFTYFSQSARMDLDDYHNNFYAGIHGANMAGTWQAIVNGFGGLRTNAGLLEFHPYCPEQWESYCFRITYRKSLIEITIKPDEIAIQLLNEAPAEFNIGKTTYHLYTKGDRINEKI